jgi:hypothetical protein
MSKRFLEIFREKMAPLINRRVEDYALEAAKEWLTQKRQSKAMNFYELQIIDELLGELEK